MADMKLKNCPFCGGNASLIPHIHNKTYEVRCLNENCYEGCALHTPEEAVKHWNTRASDSTIEAQEAEIKRLREALKRIERQSKDLDIKYTINEITQAALKGE